MSRHISGSGGLDPQILGKGFSEEYDWWYITYVQAIYLLLIPPELSERRFQLYD